jgi:LmbE family N-acetylglucosaminyl deacetylase
MHRALRACVLGCPENGYSPGVATLVTFHAHPDDEAISCGGTIAKAVAEGHRVVLVVATKGENGEVAEGFLRPGETLAERRVKEQEEACRILGIARLEWLGYVDSGMIGTPENDAPESFWSADIEPAAARLARILQDENADILTHYDPAGTYGHPDHIQCNRVGLRAAGLAGTPRLYESVANRDHFKEGLARLTEEQLQGVQDGGLDLAELDELGVAASEITTAIEVGDYLGLKRSAMAAHASQIADTSFFLAMPPELFEQAFGIEWFIRRDAGGKAETSLFEGI